MRAPRGILARVVPIAVLAWSLVGCSSGDAAGTAIDAAPSCSGGQLDCGGVCTSVVENPKNCGACGVACAFPFSCRASACVCDERSPNLTLTGTIDGATFDKAYKTGSSLLDQGGAPFFQAKFSCDRGNFYLTWSTVTKYDVVTNATGTLLLPGDAAARSLGAGTTITLRAGQYDLHLVGEGVDVNGSVTTKL